MKTPLLLFVVLSVFGFSCSKERIRHRVEFAGRVTDMYTHVPVPNASITLNEEYDYGQSGHQYIHGTPTDQDGNYYFLTHDLHTNETNVYIEVGDPAIHLQSTKNIHVNYDELNRNDIEVATSSLINFYFHNASPYNANDSLWNIYIERPWGHQIVGSADTVLRGMNVNGWLRSGYLGYTSSVLHYTVTKNGNSQAYTDTLLTPSQGIIVSDSINY